MANRPAYPRLLDETQFELLARLEIDDLIPFVLACWKERSPIVPLYYGLLLVVSGLCGYGIGTQITHLGWWTLFWLVCGVLVMGTLGVVVHELLHAGAYVLLGARHIRFGADLRHYAFYAMADRFSVSWVEFAFVALAPFVLLTAASVALGTALGQGFLVAGLGGACMSLFMSSGDIALLNGFWKHRHDGLWTCDDWKTHSTVFVAEKGMVDATRA